MAKYLVIVESHLELRVDADSPEEAQEQWRERTAGKTESTCGGNLRATIFPDKMVTVLCDED